MCVCVFIVFKFCNIFPKIREFKNYLNLKKSDIKFKNIFPKHKLVSIIKCSLKYSLLLSAFAL